MPVQFFLFVCYLYLHAIYLRHNLEHSKTRKKTHFSLEKPFCQHIRQVPYGKPTHIVCQMYEKVCMSNHLGIDDVKLVCVCVAKV